MGLDQIVRHFAGIAYVSTSARNNRARPQSKRILPHAENKTAFIRTAPLPRWERKADGGVVSDWVLLLALQQGRGRPANPMLYVWFTPILVSSQEG
jgi:hypothetical protein